MSAFGSTPSSLRGTLEYAHILRSRRHIPLHVFIRVTRGEGSSNKPFNFVQS